MAITDPIADMLTRMRNALTIRQETVMIPVSNIKVAMAEILLREGYIKSYKIVKEGKFDSIKVVLKYTAEKKSVISGLKRISKPGLRVYASKDELPRVLGGLGIAIISTNKGVITDKEARNAGVGGEVLAYIW